MSSFLNILLQADGQVYSRNWIVWFVFLLIIAGSWFAWHRNRKNIERNKRTPTNDNGEVIV